MLSILLSTLVLTTGQSTAISIRGDISKKNVSDRPCVVEGNIFQHGEIFAIKYSGPCIKYTCNQGGYAPTTIECDGGNGTCHAIGSVRTMHKCIQQRCEKTERGVGFRTVQGGCSFANGCLQVGQTAEDRCFLYECKQKDLGDQISYHVDLVKDGCFQNASPPYKCLAVNETTKDGCVTKRCEKKNNSYVYGIYDAESGCKDGNMCRPIGSTWTDGCVTKTCVKENPFPGYTRLRAERSNQQCEDVNGTCHPIGSTFPKRLYGQLHQNCSCDINFNTIVYSCRSKRA